VDVVRDPQALGAVPACTIQYQHDLLLGSGSHLPGKGSQLGLEHRDVHAGGQMKDGPAWGGMDKAYHVAPFIAMLHGGTQTLAVATPDLVQDRLESNAMFVDGPQLDAGLWERWGDLAQERTQTRLECRLRHGIRLDVSWTRLEELCAHLPQGAPGWLASDGPTQLCAHPCRYRASAPAVTRRMERCQSNA
jgi:hypothetical protein